MGDVIQAIYNSIARDPHTLMGPLLFFYLYDDGTAGTTAWGIIFTLPHLGAFVLAIVKPRWWTALIALVALMTWLFIGAVILGMGC